jgi:hypothetical protein
MRFVVDASPWVVGEDPTMSGRLLSHIVLVILVLFLVPIMIHPGSRRGVPVHIMMMTMVMLILMLW